MPPPEGRAPAREAIFLRLRPQLSIVTNVVSLVLLVHFLINGGKAGGHSLILSGVVLWVPNVLLFAVWYWEMDRGGPVERHQNPHAWPDFQFPQMENPQLAPPGWRPGFGDYLYTSLTNATISGRCRSNFGCCGTGLWRALNGAASASARINRQVRLPFFNTGDYELTSFLCEYRAIRIPNPASRVTTEVPP